MADVFDDVLDDIGADFETLGVGLKPITVTRIDADTGESVTVAEEVRALKRVRKRQDGDTVPSDGCRFVFRSQEWTITSRDTVTDYDGQVWSVDSVEVIGSGALVAVNCTKKRS